MKRWMIRLLVPVLLVLALPAAASAVETDWGRANAYMGAKGIPSYSVKLEYQGKSYILDGGGTASLGMITAYLGITKDQFELAPDFVESSKPEAFSAELEGEEWKIRSDQDFDSAERLTFAWRGKTYRINASSGGIPVADSYQLSELLWYLPATDDPVRLILSQKDNFFDRPPETYSYGYNGYDVQSGQNIHLDMAGMHTPGRFHVTVYRDAPPARVLIENGEILQLDQQESGITLGGNAECTLTGVTIRSPENGITVSSELQYDCRLELNDCRISGGHYGLEMMYGTAVINGGEISGMWVGADFNGSTCTLNRGVIRYDEAGDRENYNEGVHMIGQSEWYEGNLVECGKFVMNGGEIRGVRGAGLVSTAEFIQNGGEIFGTEKGVQLNGARFSMNGGTITGCPVGMYINGDYNYFKPVRLNGDPGFRGNGCDIVCDCRASRYPALEITETMTNAAPIKVRMPDEADGDYAFTTGFGAHNPGRDPSEVFLSLSEGRVVSQNEEKEGAFVPGRKIFYEPNGGSGSMRACQIPEGAAAAVDENGFTRQRYRFTGWNTEKDGTGETVLPGREIRAESGSEDLTLYAVWKVNRINLSKVKVTGIKTKTYNGKARKQTPVLRYSGERLKAGRDYTVKYKNNVNAGRATMTITGRGWYTGELVRRFTVKKAKNPLRIKGRTVRVRFGAARKIAASKAIAFRKKGKGRQAYRKRSGAKAVSVDRKTGRITIRKGLKRGVHRIRIRVRAAGNRNYRRSAWKTAVVRILVR